MQIKSVISWGGVSVVWFHKDFYILEYDSCGYI